MFEMTAAQKAAFAAATGGVTGHTFARTIACILAMVVTVWLLFVFIGLMNDKKRPLSDALFSFTMAVGLYIAAGALIYFI